MVARARGGDRADPPAPPPAARGPRPRSRRLAEAVLVRTGWPVVWAAGNHDVRGAMREHLLGQQPGPGPLDAAVEVRGLRIVSVDTSIPGRVEGGLDDAQLERLRATLASPAEHGTVLVLHHPPVPVEVTGLQRLHLTGQGALADAVRGSDVRAILGGHLHYATTAVFAGVPVFVAPSTAYTIRITEPGGGVIATDGGRSVGVLSLYDDGRAAWTTLPTEPATVLASTPDEVFEGMGVDVER